ncbi:hypothetical protein ACHWQZ_G011243 [Mnemiopsis leidyi]
MAKTLRKTAEVRPGQYIGQTLNQVRHGHGKYLYDNTFFTYEGDWLEGVKHGKGKLSMRDGGYYDGDFVNGEITGKGERLWSNGNIYVGEFEQGELCGTGQMKYSDGRRYTGQWTGNKYEGKGTLHSGEGDIYTGHFHLHKRHGDGEQVWADGRHYEGGWVANKPHGHGTMKYADGSVYEGQYNHGLRQGQGTYTHVTGITYSGLWIKNEIPPEEFAAGMAFVGSTEVEIYQGESFSIELAVLHSSGNVMEGDTGRELEARVGLLSIPKGDKNSKIKNEIESSSVTFETPFGEVKAANIAAVSRKDPRLEEYEELSEKNESPEVSDEKDRTGSRAGYDYINLPTPTPTSPLQSTHCGHASWVNVCIPGHDMIETVESEDEEGDLVEEAKPKAKKKGKNSPATTRKERSATPDDREKWKKEGPRAERDKDLLKYAAPGTYIIKISDVTKPTFFDNILQPIFMKVNILKIKKSSNKYLLPKSPVTNRRVEK